MPTISAFFGIYVRMFYRDHPSPHFHAIYGEYRACVAIQNGEIIEGRLPSVARRLVLEWLLLTALKPPPIGNVHVSARLSNA